MAPDAKAELLVLNTPSVEPDNEPDSPQTGDSSKLWLWFAVLFISGGGLFGLKAYERMRKVN